MVDERRIELSQIARDFVIASSDDVLDPDTRAELHATVDSNHSQWSILLPDGLGLSGNRESRLIDLSQAAEQDDIPF